MGKGEGVDLEFALCRVASLWVSAPSAMNAVPANAVKAKFVHQVPVVISILLRKLAELLDIA